MRETSRELALMGQAARDILETMFFATPEDAATPEPWPAGLLTAELRFEGAMSGDFRIHIEESCAGAIAGNFTGAMDPAELDSETTSGVLCELANMICGATLSRMEPKSIFKLGQPRLAQPGLSGDPQAAQQWLRMDEGLIGLQLRVEDNP